jgi:hypothetical protein
VKYSIDTSAILDGWVRYYPPDIFPPLWRKLEQLADSGHLRASEEVLRELEKKDDDVHAWARERDRMFVSVDDEIQVAVADLLGRFPRLVNTQRDRSMGDPWVIALAQVHSCIVVTGEQNRGTTDRPRIPDVCDAIGIRSISLLGLIREEKWVFG